MVESGFSSTDLGKLILAACFVTDFGTVLALGAFFADFNRWMLVFIAVLAVMLWYLPRWTKADHILFRREPRQRAGGQISLFRALLSRWLGDDRQKRSGLSGLSRRTCRRRCLSTGQSSGTPHARDRLYDAYSFLFHQSWTLRLFAGAGLPVPALSSCFLVVKLVAKLIGVWPLARAFGLGNRESNYTTLLWPPG